MPGVYHNPVALERPSDGAARATVMRTIDPSDFNPVDAGMRVTTDSLLSWEEV